nr:alpha-mannosidase [Cohnella sp. REN36]
MLLTARKLEARIRELERFRYIDHRQTGPYRLWVDQEAVVGAMPPEDAQWTEIGLGGRWRGWDLTAWLKAEVTVPAEWAGKKMLGLFDFGKTGYGHTSGFESLLFLNGKPYQGVGGNHREVFLPPETAGQKIELLFKVWTGLNGMTPDKSELEHEIRCSALALVEPDTDDLYFTSLAVSQTIQVLDENSWESRSLLKALDRAFQWIDWRTPGSTRFYESVKEANGKLKQELEAIPKQSAVTVRCIGSTHIDVAWLWTLKHTREKAARSFSTVLRLMEQFPEYVFMVTQPQLYEDLERDYPQLMEQIEERIGEGRWEAKGAMWLESDCNVPSGESLVRQLLYGMRFFEQKYGSQCEYLWLPDVFGYSWALPQILQKAGLRYFMTTKISWNIYNRFPHDTYYWRGIDGTEILTHYITTPHPGHDKNGIYRFYTYNGEVLPETVTGIWDNYRDKEINEELLLAFGYGDGGGGPTREMLEMRRRLNRMPGLPNVTTGRADEFFNQLENNVRSSDRYVHKWDGELYLELHRGTYTSQAFIKKRNRQMEHLLRNAEIVSAFWGALAGFGSYPSDRLYESWKIVLRNQFHDILPGSSIAEVYEDSRLEYAEAEKLAAGAFADGFGRLAGLVPAGESPSWIVFNTLTWDRDECIRLPWENHFGNAIWESADGQRLATQRIQFDNGEDALLVRVRNIPGLGYTTVYCKEAEEASADVALRAADQPVQPFLVAESSVATPFYEIEWNAEGQLTRLYDKRTNRELIAAGETANRFDVHEDKPLNNDAWDIDIFYYESVRQVNELKSVRVVEQDELRAVIRFNWAYERSTIEQDMILYADDPRIDFPTRVHWQEHQQLLKVAFPLAVRATSATHEIQFGNVQRPTLWNNSWDFARFETCAQRWIDLSERGCGVSLLNDCKYGHDVRDHVMRLTLIKSAVSPDANADIGDHAFTYSLLPHEGDWFAAGTMIQAARLNIPVEVAKLGGGTSAEADARNGDSLPPTLRFFGTDSDHVAIDTIKKAEDSEDWIVRCYEFAGKRGTVRFASSLPIHSVDEVNLMEREASSVAHTDEGFETNIKPYEIKSFRIRFS